MISTARRPSAPSTAGGSFGFDGGQEVGQLVAMAMMADGGRIGGPAAGAGPLAHPLFYRRVGANGFGKIPLHDVFFFHRGRAGRAVHLDPLQIAGPGGGGGFDHAQRTAGEAERGHGRVFDGDPLVGQRGDLARISTTGPAIQVSRSTL